MRNGEWIVDYASQKTYDEKGYLIKSESQQWSNGILNTKSKYTYSNNSLGKDTLILKEEWSSNQWLNAYRYKTDYGVSNNVVFYLLEEWSTDHWEKYITQRFTYHLSGQLFSDIQEDWSNAQLENVLEYYHFYDYYGNLSNSTHVFWSKNLQDTSMISYSYDDFGNCVHADNLVRMNNTWLNRIGTFKIFFNKGESEMYLDGKSADIKYATFVKTGNGDLNKLSFSLSQNYPNPFNPSTTINYTIAKEGNVKLTVYDLLGSKVETIVDEFKIAGIYSVSFNGSKLASGVYIYRLESGDYFSAKKFILLK